MGMTGAINPWDKTGTQFTEQDLCWDVEGFTTPFAAFSYLLQNWPGPTQTAEQPEDVRHQRLVETIAGYPEIASGRRPLDMPLHTKSVISFKLTNFLDKIPGPEELEWHSLKTALLHYDLRRHGKGMNYEQFFLHMMAKIRYNTTYADNKESTKYLPNALHDDEIEFITVLHSHNNESAKYWPVFGEETEKLIFSNLDGDQEYNSPTRIKSNQKRNNFIPHEFKFKKIQTWIQNWTQCAFIEDAWLSKDASQHLIVGASVMLESVLAKMRSYILMEKRPGALIVDGGGRLRYLSQNSREEEATWFKEKIERIFLFDPKHLHPYQERISIVLETYIQNIADHIKLSHPFQSHLLKLFFKSDPVSSHKLSTQGYQILIGKEPTRYFLPDISEGEGSKSSADGSIEYGSLFNKKANSKPVEFESCVLCSCLSRPVDETEKSTVNEIICSGEFVCAFHALLHTIGKESKIRLQSQPDLFRRRSRQLLPSEKGVQKMLVFDGNAIGQLFNQPFNDWKPPPNSPDLSTVWEANKNSIMNIREREPWDVYTIGDQKQWTSFFCRRMQAMLRIQRRSFSFNTNWWLSLQKAMKETREASMVPWIMAGDDIVLVNHLDLEDNAIKTMLSKFQENLQELFPPNVPVTFAGSLQYRGELTIIQMYEKARKLEAIAGYLWKWHADSLNDEDDVDVEREEHDWNLLEKSKRKKLEKWLEEGESRSEQCEALLKRLNAEKFMFMAGETEYTSLILTNNLANLFFANQFDSTG